VLDEKCKDHVGTTNSRSRAPIFALTASMLVLALVVVWTFRQARTVAESRSASHELHPEARTSSPWKNTRPDVKYVGDSTCARCHADIALAFSRHPMGRSLALLSSADGRADAATSFDADLYHYAVERRGGHEVHRESRLDERGHVLAQIEAEVKYAVGSGTRGTSYLIEHDGRLFQSPITWYTEKNRWDVSPGYGTESPHFDRPIDVGCLFCHTNRVEPIEYTVNRYKEPIFRGHAIGCERCHGPGALHSQHQELVDGRDLTIVNPRHLEPALRSAVCEQCHLEGDHRVERLDRKMFDYRPGLPLIEFFAVYGRADQRETKFVGHVEQMKMSRCFRESKGRLGCISCHDPHQTPPPQEKVAYFRQQCLACHEDPACSLPSAVRLAKSTDDNCIQCHMQRSETIDIAHAATTDHRIRRMPPAPATAARPVVHGLPLVLLNGDNLSREELQSLERELAIALALEAPLPRAMPQARAMGPVVLSLLDKSLAKRPDDLASLRMKAQLLALAGRLSEALQVIQAALRIAPMDERAIEQYLAYAVDARDFVAAVEPARRAVSANSWSSVFHERLAFFSLENHDWPSALRESREALRKNPFLRFARMFAIQSLLHQNDLRHAEEEFALLIKLNPAQRESLETWFGEQRRK
jgi:Cytochrome c554 and c-prime